MLGMCVTESLAERVLFKAVGLDEITRNEYTQRKMSRTEHRGMPSFRTESEIKPMREEENP